MKLKSLGAEAILVGMISPLVIWIIVSIFDLKKSEAVTETKYQNIIEKIDILRDDIKNGFH